MNFIKNLNQISNDLLKIRSLNRFFNTLTPQSNKKMSSDALEPGQNKIIIVYATQTGQSKTIAETLNDEAIQNGFDSTLYNIEQYDKDFKLNEINDPLIFVCSTTGDGETPESARKCFSRLKRLDKEENQNYLSNLNYALLGLGDTNYTQFCNGPKLFHNRFLELGAKCFYGPAWADDAVGLEQVVEPFKEDLWDALDKFFENRRKPHIGHEQNDLCAQINKLAIKNDTIGDELTLPELVENNFTIDYLESGSNLSEIELVKVISILYQQSSTGVYKAVVTNNEIITRKESEKDCYDIKFKLIETFTNDGTKLNDLKFKYEPGYAIDVMSQNSQDEVEKLLERLNIKDFKTKLIKIRTKDSSKKLGQTYSKLTDSNQINLEFLFKYCVEIRTNALKKNFLRMLSSYCQNENDSIRLMQLCSKEGSDEYQTLIKENLLTVLDILNIFKSCQPPIEHLIQMLPAMNARSYSLCSFNDETNSNNEMEFIFNLVKFKQTNNRTYERNGIATDYLSKLKIGESFYFMKRKFNNFSFPTDFTKPIIMIGPGTGIAPFIGYLRYLKFEMDNKGSLNSKLWLFYGCRDPEKDFLFKNELMNYVAMLDKFSISFSRFTYDPNDKSKEETDLINFIDQHHIPSSKYVQDSIKVYSKEVVHLIHDLNGFIYVCGDAKNMSKDVFNCFVDCLCKELSLSCQEANKYLMDMIKDKRYKQDIWA